MNRLGDVNCGCAASFLSNLFDLCCSDWSKCLLTYLFKCLLTYLSCISGNLDWNVVWDDNWSTLGFYFNMENWLGWRGKISYQHNSTKRLNWSISQNLQVNKTSKRLGKFSLDITQESHTPPITVEWSRVKDSGRTML